MDVPAEESIVLPSSRVSVASASNTPTSEYTQLPVEQGSESSAPIKKKATRQAKAKAKDEANALAREVVTKFLKDNAGVEISGNAIEKEGRPWANEWYHSLNPYHQLDTSAWTTFWKKIANGADVKKTWTSKVTGEEKTREYREFDAAELDVWLATLPGYVAMLRARARQLQGEQDRFGVVAETIRDSFLWVKNVYADRDVIKQSIKLQLLITKVRAIGEEDWLRYVQRAATQIEGTLKDLEGKINDAMFARDMLAQKQQLYAILVDDWELREEGNSYAHPSSPPDETLKNLWKRAVLEAKTRFPSRGRDLETLLGMVTTDYTNLEVGTAVAPMDLLLAAAVPQQAQQ